MMKKRIVINIFSNNMGRFFEMVLGLALVPFLIKVLGGAGFGLIVFAEALIMFFTQAVNGFYMALGRYVGFNLALGKKDETSDYIASGEAILMGIMAILAVIGLLMAVFFTKLFNVPEIFTAEMKPLFLLLVISFLVQIRFVSAWSIVYAHQRFDLINIFTGLRTLTRFLLCYIIYLVIPARLYYYGWIYLAAILVEQLLIFAYAKRLFPALKIWGARVSTRKAKELLSFMMYFSAGTLGRILYSSTAMILINLFFGAYYNGVYVVSLKFARVLQRLISRSFWGVTPSFTELVAKKDYKRVERIYTSITKTAAIVVIPVCILLGLFGKEFILIWVGDEFLSAVVPMYVHILGVMPGLIFACSGSIMLAYSKVKVPGIVTLCCAVLNVFLGILSAVE